MNKAFRFVFALFAFVMLVGVFSLTDANAQGGPLREAINRMDAMNKSLVSLKVGCQNGQIQCPAW